MSMSVFYESPRGNQIFFYTMCAEEHTGQVVMIQPVQMYRMIHDIVHSYIIIRLNLIK